MNEINEQQEAELRMVSEATRQLVCATFKEENALTTLLEIFKDYPDDRRLIVLDGISDITNTLHGILNEIERKLNASREEQPATPPAAEPMHDDPTQPWGDEPETEERDDE